MINWLYGHFYNTLCGFFFAIAGYFLEIRGAVHVMWAALALDLLFGILVSVVRRGEKFSMTKAFVGIGRALGSTALVALLYGMDKEMHQVVAASYYVAAWVISGFYAWSINQNLELLFGGGIFTLLKKIFSRRLQEQAGINIENLENEKHDKDTDITSIKTDF